MKRYYIFYLRESCQLPSERIFEVSIPLFVTVCKTEQNGTKIRARTAISEKIQYILKSGCDRSSYLTDILTDFSGNCNNEKFC